MVLVLGLYFGTDVISNKQRTLEKSRVLVKQTKSKQLVLRDAYHKLTAEQRTQVDEIKVLLERAEDESRRLGLLETLAGLWYRWGHYDISGIYAEEIAEKRNTAEAWAITGTTFTRGIQLDKDERTRQFCAEKARAAFDQAKIIEPENPEVDLNKALTYVYMPESSNPMAGIQQLLQLKDAYPDYGPVYRYLGMLANQTGQFQRALERLRMAWVLEEDREEVGCLLTETFTALSMPDSARFYSQYCKN